MDVIKSRPEVKIKAGLLLLALLETLRNSKSLLMSDAGVVYIQVCLKVPHRMQIRLCTIIFARLKPNKYKPLIDLEFLILIRCKR